jgi:hypothetical protein
LLRCPVEMHRDFRSRCLPMTDGREADVALGLASLRDEPKVGTAALQATGGCGDCVPAEATTCKDFPTLSRPRVLPLLRLVIPALELRSTENDSLCCCEPAR